VKLPAGVFDRPRQRELIAKDAWGIIRIDTRRYEDNQRYDIKDQSFGEHVAPYLQGDWEEFDRFFQLDPYRPVYVQGQLDSSPVLYSGAVHSGNPGRGYRKLPNITVVPNFSTAEARGLARPFTAFGCTMGHSHPAVSTGSQVQEVYEFQCYGCLALDREEGHVELWVAQDGDKVAVPSGCHATLYNLGDKDNPLITLDFSNPANCNPNRDLAREYGPSLLAYYDDFEAVFTLNRLYSNHPGHKAGVRLAHTHRERRDREVRIRRGGRLDLGRLLHEELTLNPEAIGAFACLGIRIRKATPEVVLEPLSSGKGIRLYFSQPLVEATTPGTDVYRYFFPESEPMRPKAPSWRPVSSGTAETAE